MEEVHAKIQVLIQSRKDRRIVPHHTTLHELGMAMPERSKASIALDVSHLEQAGKIKTGDTINSRWIKLIN